MFDKILIANRGEIACRIMRTARRFGVATVAVYSKADAEAMHVAMADEAFLIGPPRVADSYLKAERIIEAAKRSGAEAIHPGYGFLAENAEFAETCAASGIVFIGPPPAAIRAMGLKGTAKAIMEEAGVPVVPGYHGEAQSRERLAAEAERIGYPVLIKAVAGGGGKGMRRVDRPGDFEAALAAAGREAQSAFGSADVLIEKYLQKPRHIEIQVFADAKGNALHLFERDCSVQRRHQKVLEEAPAPDMPVEMRAKMGEAAVRAAEAIGYQGAGTVEFIADVSEGLSADAFYFMEMNTRLQVEHPVTEAITGVDLVEWQLRVAGGEVLPMTQAELAINGHAIEARLYAEDPSRDFLPATGRLNRLRPPEASAEVRIDTGVREGDLVTSYYDPMIAKLIVWGEDRTQALRRMAQALGDYRIAGVTTNVEFLRRLVLHPAFAAGELDTGFIQRHAAELMPVAEPVSDRVLALASLAALARRAAEAATAAEKSADPYSPFHWTDGWRVNGEGHDVLQFVAGEDVHDVTVHYPDEPGFVLALPGGRVAGDGRLTDDGDLVADLDGERIRAGVAFDGDTMVLLTDRGAYRLEIYDPLHVAADEEDVAHTVNAPLPGKIIQVMVETGATVAKGEPLIVMEAMKMEHTIHAPAAGTVASVNFSAGDQVEEGVILVAFEEETKQ